MADLSRLKAADSSKIVGSDSTGDETYFVAATPQGDLKTSVVLNQQGISASLSVGITATQVKAGGSNLVDRKLLIFTVDSNGYTWGFSNINQPFPINNGQVISLQIGPNVSIWIIKSSGSGNVGVAEIS
jgi:hypothetical protein